MLHTLTIRDFVIVDHIELEFSAGFSVLTGETGAGKSILIDALSLALGARGDASMVREGATKADICAEFSANALGHAWLAEQEIEIEDDTILLRRLIDSTGRSKAYINGIAATAAQLRELGALLVNIHGQHAHQSLLQHEAQRALLDDYAKLNLQVSKVSQLYQYWRTLRQQRQQFENNAKQILLEQERLTWQINELEKLHPQPEEWQAITHEHSRLTHAANLIEGAQYASQAISESDHPILSQLNAIQQRLAKLVEYDANLQPILDNLEPARIHLQEAASALNDYLSRVELDPARLHEVEQRLEALHSCARKFHVTPEQLPELFNSLAQELANLGTTTDLATLHALEQAALEQYQHSAQQLSQARLRAAKQLSDAVSHAMQELSMIGGRFHIELTSTAPSAHGLDQIEFRVAGHIGVATRPLAKVASGGELARIALAISVITSTSATTPTLIFDEVDSGIGGGVAEVVGRLLKRLGQQAQVLCVTHLAQVASQADQHFQVSKISRASGTVSQIALLDRAARIEEIARMLGGVEITTTTRKHARELLAH
jgi:DNA repair protein RecN (Recombination protein N)